MPGSSKGLGLRYRVPIAGGTYRAGVRWGQGGVERAQKQASSAFETTARSIFDLRAVGRHGGGYLWGTAWPEELLLAAGRDQTARAQASAAGQAVLVAGAERRG